MMGKQLVVCLIVCLLVFTVTACTEPMDAVPSIGSVEGYPGRVDVARYEEGKLGRNTIVGDAARQLTERLEKMKPVGRTEGKICEDREWDANSVAEEVPEGTVWIKTENSLYRLNIQEKTACMVETHYGEGILLNAEPAFFEWQDGLRFAPYNTDICYYRDGELETSHRLIAPTTAKVKVKSVTVADQDAPLKTPYGSKYWVTVTVEIVSLEDQTLRVALHPIQTGDNMLLAYGEEVELKKGEVKEMQLPLMTHWPTHWRGGYIKADNTWIILLNEK